MIFDTTLRIAPPFGAQLQQDDRGDSYELHFIAAVALMLPTPQGAVPIQAGVLRLPMDKEMVEAAIEILTEAKDQLKVHSNIAVAGSMTDADQIAAQLGRANGPGR